MDIEQSADACGGLAWISEQLFEIEGRLAIGLVEGEPLDPRHAGDSGPLQSPLRPARPVVEGHAA